MYRFWDNIIKLIFEILQPKSIVEIGADNGNNTRNILEYCIQQDATLYSIDPLPKFDVSAWQEQYGKRFVFFKSLSLNVIPKIDKFDAVLIDGDHNWYTVFNELKLIEKRCQEINQHFPLIILHDIGWPYGRRDLYYRPENIPEAYRQPYEKKGVLPGVSELQEKGGLNAHLFNSIYENNLQNGVLTAIEDFLKESKQAMGFIKIPGLYGLAILYTLQLKEQNQDLAILLAKLVVQPVLEKYIDRIEFFRVVADVGRLEHRTTSLDKESEVKGLQQQLAEMEQALFRSKEVQSLQASILLDKESEVKGLQQQLAEMEQALFRSKEVQALHASKLLDKESEVKALQQQLDNNIEQRNREFYEHNNRIKRQAQDIEKLMYWIERINDAVLQLLNSHRWKIGNAIGEIQRRILFRNSRPMAVDYINNINRNFREWKTIYDLQAKGIGNNTNSILYLKRILHQLVNSINSMLLTRRWKIGNAIGIFYNILTGKNESPCVLEQIDEVILQFHNWSPKVGNEISDIQKLRTWIEQLQSDYKVLLYTRRWKVGDRVVSFFNTMLFKNKKAIVISHIEDIFSNFNEWKKSIHNMSSVITTSVPAVKPSQNISNMTLEKRSGPVVMYLSGEPGKPGEVYRVLNYIEALKLAGIEANYVRENEIFIDDKWEALIEAELLIVWRHVHTHELEYLIEQRKIKGYKTVFDIDDLIIRPDIAKKEYVDAIRFNKLDPDAVSEKYSLFKKALLLCDYGFASTERLAEEIRNLGKDAFVLRNGLGRRTIEESAAAFLSRKLRNRHDNKIRIGYSAGSRTHQKDFSICVPALSEILRRYPEVIFVSFKATLDLREFPELNEFKNRIELRSMTDLVDLQYENARFDINIAPLEVGNIFCEAKSELKYFEAAMVGVPTVASPTGPFKSAITNGVNGFLASTTDEWIKYLSNLIEDPSLRKYIAKNAEAHARVYYGLENLGNLAKQVISHIEPRFWNTPQNPWNTRDTIEIGLYEVIYSKQQDATAGELAVIVPLYNYEMYIRECLESVACQTIHNSVDLIIVNDSSTDNSLKVALEWAKKNSSKLNAVHLLSHRYNKGLAVTRNTGIDYSDTSYYFPLDADNILTPNCLEQCLNLMRANDANKNIAGVYPSRKLFGETTTVFKNTGIMLEVGKWDVNRLEKGNYIDAMALVRRSAWKRVGGYKDVTKKAGWQDYDFWCKFVEEGFRCLYCREAVALYRTHHKSMLHTRTNEPENKKELLDAIITKHPWLKLR